MHSEFYLGVLWVLFSCSLLTLWLKLFIMLKPHFKKFFSTLSPILWPSLQIREWVGLTLFCFYLVITIWRQRGNLGSEESTNWIVSTMLTLVFFPAINCEWLPYRYLQYFKIFFWNKFSSSIMVGIEIKILFSF